MSKVKPSLMTLAVVTASLLLGACDEEEQNRVLLYDKGSYLGAPDTELSDDTLKALRQRAARQRGQ